MRELVEKELTDTPMYGFIRYRRRNVLIKVVPEGASRVVKGNWSPPCAMRSERGTGDDGCRNRVQTHLIDEIADRQVEMRTIANGMVQLEHRCTFSSFLSAFRLMIIRSPSPNRRTLPTRCFPPHALHIPRQAQYRLQVRHSRIDDLRTLPRRPRRRKMGRGRSASLWPKQDSVPANRPNDHDLLLRWSYCPEIMRIPQTRPRAVPRP